MGMLERALSAEKSKGELRAEVVEEVFNYGQRMFEDFSHARSKPVYVDESLDDTLALYVEGLDESKWLKIRYELNRAVISIYAEQRANVMGRETLDQQLLFTIDGRHQEIRRYFEQSDPADGKVLGYNKSLRFQQEVAREVFDSSRFIKKPEETVVAS